MPGTIPAGYPAAPAARARILRARMASLTNSLETYWGDPDALARMDALYAQFVRPGSLAFDVGAHVGDRVGAFRRLGARVVAVEAQDECARVIGELFCGDDSVTVVRCACGREAGQIDFHINSANATVATASKAFVTAAEDAERWSDQVWDLVTTVPCIPLDSLIAQHGRPDFIKIDVEGFEADVLAGLSEAVAALSFEFTTIQRDVAMRCLERIGEIGRYRFNCALGEEHVLRLADWCDAAAIGRVISELPDDANSGDIYAVLEAE